MLIDFAVSNFRSIRDRQNLSMLRGVRRKDDAKRQWLRADLAPVVAIFGANAAGKSSIVDAIRYVHSAVDDSYSRWSADGGIAREPFLLDQESRTRPTEFDVEFVAADGREYRYGFAVNDDRVVWEYLHLYRTRRKTVLFERDLNDFKFGDSFRGPAALLKETTRDNALFISAAAAARLEATEPAHAWLTEKLAVYAAMGYRAEHAIVKRKIQQDAAYRHKLLKFLGAADLGVQEIDVVREELDLEDRQRIRDYIDAQENPGMKYDELLSSFETEISLTHQGQGMVSALPFDAESDGTHALLSFASVAIRALDEGLVCVVDEIDTSLHPMLVAELVAVFADPRVNVNQAQLIFTTHDVSLLRSGTALERDAIWIVDKSSEGSSKLTSLVEYGLPRKEENLERGYLTGRYGGLPYLSIVNSLIQDRAKA
ncbi:ATP-binding protein [Rathayibacter sp. ZW T2_19]|uniref:ATP-binding protein n=1 Tax=Rathayibacter rubneri TaxID=2950106 RepID=A0A9X2DVB2_9MICO|nr:ATP-binding protein [Rathayibacter rubneri]MCM6761169.1 ATP-binding protein [Rathayibacter rubneri]